MKSRICANAGGFGPAAISRLRGGIKAAPPLEQTLTKLIQPLDTSRKNAGFRSTELKFFCD
jgi:hypothetical protein